MGATTQITTSLADYLARVGQEVGVSDWIEIDQHRIDAFAETTLDDQYIHDATRYRGRRERCVILHQALSALPLNRNRTLERHAI